VSRVLRGESLDRVVAAGLVVVATPIVAMRSVFSEIAPRLQQGAVVTDVASTDAAFIARRWGSALWLAWDWLMLTSAIAHGAAGIWIAIDDYTASGARRRALQRLLVAVSAVLLALGTATISAAILG